MRLGAQLTVFVIAAVFFGNVVLSRAAQIVPMAKFDPTAISETVAVFDAPKNIEPRLVRFGTDCMSVEFCSTKLVPNLFWLLP